MRKTDVEQAQEDLNRIRRELAETVADVKVHLGDITHFSPWVQKYPKSIFAVTFVAGLLAGRFITFKGLPNGLAKASEFVLGGIVKGAIR